MCHKHHPDTCTLNQQPKLDQNISALKRLKLLHATGRKKKAQGASLPKVSAMTGNWLILIPGSPGCKFWVWPWKEEETPTGWLEIVNKGTAYYLFLLYSGSRPLCIFFVNKKRIALKNMSYLYHPFLLLAETITAQPQILANCSYQKRPHYYPYFTHQESKAQRN